MRCDPQHSVELLSRLIRVRSLPGHEGELAGMLEAELTQLGFPRVERDDYGNVLTCVAGCGKAPPVMFNTHLDHVDVGDIDQWPVPPFEGRVGEHAVWGRGAVDIKGPLAAQVVGLALLLDEPPPPGDVWLSAVVQEEIGGVGARHLANAPPCRLVVVGEPSSNTLRRGHRGRTEIVLHIRGRSVHASVPKRGANPLFPAARVLTRLHELHLAGNAELGTSTIAPTLLRTDQTSANVIPGEVWQTFDVRTVPELELSSLVAQLRLLAEQASGGEFTVDVSIPVVERTTYTGKRMAIAAENPPYLLAEDHPAVRAAGRVFTQNGATSGATVWQFATDGGHFARAGMVPIGFGPGNEFLAHTIDEQIPIDQLLEATHLNHQMAQHFATAAKEFGCEG